MKKISILAGVFGILFATQTFANNDKAGKDWGNITEEQKAEFKQKKEERLQKCMETGKSQEECTQKMKEKMKAKKGKFKEGKQEWKEKAKGCPGKAASEEAVKTPTAKEEPARKKWFFGLF